ncbi:MAG: LLM class flavin-dependent oxidoreductase [Gammaproteobacteria bacterium]|nr:LLM class flavin-dependent oxidoreductase [Gammaproteobacteria bacterium]
MWTTEHHFAEDGWSPSLLPILSAIAARTARIRLGTFIIVLPFFITRCEWRKMPPPSTLSRTVGSISVSVKATG